MNWRNVGLIFQREVLDQLRDRRTLFMVAVLPILLYPLLGKSDMSLIGETQPIFYLMLGILSFATFGSVFVNSLSGTGATWFGLRLQVISLAVYLTYIFTAVNLLHSGLFWVWVAEIVYWSVMILMVVFYLRSERWHGVEF